MIRGASLDLNAEVAQRLNHEQRVIGEQGSSQVGFTTRKGCEGEGPVRDGLAAGDTRLSANRPVCRLDWEDVVSHARFAITAHGTRWCGGLLALPVHGRRHGTQGFHHSIETRERQGLGAIL